MGTQQDSTPRSAVQSKTRRSRSRGFKRERRRRLRAEQRSHENEVYRGDNTTDLHGIRLAAIAHRRRNKLAATKTNKIMATVVNSAMAPDASAEEVLAVGSMCLQVEARKLQAGNKSNI